jgi:hypothetical protein
MKITTILIATACSYSQAFTPTIILKTTPSGATTAFTRLHATEAETEVERLRRKARELLEEVKVAEDQLHSNLIQKKTTRDATTDSIIAYLFPSDDDGSVCELAGRLRTKRLASDTLVQIVERLHEREVAARGLEHVEPSHHDQGGVTFKRVAEVNEAELNALQGCLDRLIEAAEVLDKEFINQKTECSQQITHSDIMHWGGGNISGIMKDKAKALGREHDEQFQKRLESFYEAAKRKHSKDDVDSTGWKEGKVWNP